MAAALRHADRRRVLRRIGGVSVAVALAGVGVYAVSTRSDPGRLTCVQVASLLPAYVEGGLKTEAHQRVDEHLGKCKTCREKYEAML